MHSLNSRKRKNTFSVPHSGSKEELGLDRPFSVGRSELEFVLTVNIRKQIRESQPQPFSQKNVFLKSI